MALEETRKQTIPRQLEEGKDRAGTRNPSLSLKKKATGGPHIPCAVAASTAARPGCIQGAFWQ